jgi:hypothetical protein
MPHSILKKGKRYLSRRYSGGGKIASARRVQSLDLKRRPASLPMKNGGTFRVAAYVGLEMARYGSFASGKILERTSHFHY